MHVIVKTQLRQHILSQHEPEKKTQVQKLCLWVHKFNQPQAIRCNGVGMYAVFLCVVGVCVDPLQ